MVFRNERVVFFYNMAESVMEHENISAPKRAKGVRNPQDYHGNVIKKAKVEGVQHINHRKKLVPQRVTGENCRLV